MLDWVSLRINRPMLIQVLPQRAENPNGLADYALSLAHALREGNGIDSVFLSATSSAHAVPKQDEWQTVSLERRQAQMLAHTVWSLSAETKAQALLLHFVGYGYQKRGIPLWLANGLNIWKRRVPDIPLISIFHELYATGRPWQSGFWLSPVQKQIARSILDLSVAALTPTELGSMQLSKWNGSGADKIVATMPVFSNVGEPGRGAHPSARGAIAVVFGLAGVEDRLFGIHRPEVERILLMLGIEKVFDVGPRQFSTPRSLAGVPVISKGALPRHAVSELLQQARFGFIAYPVDVISKSGVFAAYAAHGVVPIVLSDETRLTSLEGLRSSQHFLDGLRLGSGVSLDQLASLQSELFKWYGGHAIQVQADFLAELVRAGGGVEDQRHAVTRAAGADNY
jgi:hypothetical protein